MKISNDTWLVPLPTSNDILTNRSISLRTYATLMLISNWGGKVLNENTRYLYDNKVQKHIDFILDLLKITKATFNSHIKRLSAKNVSIFTPKMINDSLVYMLKPKDTNKKNFVLVNSNLLLKLIADYDETCLRVFLVLLYTCKDETKQVTHEWLCKRIGKSTNSRRLISNALNKLHEGGFIFIFKDRVIHKVFYPETNTYVCNPKEIHLYMINKSNMSA